LDIHVEWYGNSLAAAAEMRGLASDEIAPWELNAKDDIFPVESAASPSCERLWNVELMHGCTAIELKG
jgi:hypothetical protein